MTEYQLEIKQIVDYPRCRIYRQFVQSLINDRSIRISGGCVPIRQYNKFWVNGMIRHAVFPF